ncbi:hypothetical protein Hanom_Chr03g00267431 [Helianthus anomalus]
MASLTPSKPKHSSKSNLQENVNPNTSPNLKASSSSVVNSRLKARDLIRSVRLLWRTRSGS